MIEIKNLIFLVTAVLIFSSCQMGNKENKKKEMEKFDEGSFGHDLKFLKDKDSVIVLKTMPVMHSLSFRLNTRARYLQSSGIVF